MAGYAKQRNASFALCSRAGTSFQEGVARVFYIAPAFLPNEAEVGRRAVATAVAAGVERIVFSSVIRPVISGLSNHIGRRLLRKRSFMPESNTRFSDVAVAATFRAAAFAACVEETFADFPFVFRAS
jgi:hypothetical protein